jgi:hypothetical protein
MIASSGFRNHAISQAIASLSDCSDLYPKISASIENVPFEEEPIDGELPLGPEAGLVGEAGEPEGGLVGGGLLCPWLA